jgi:hypothetical protein
MTMVMRLQRHLDTVGYTAQLHAKLMEYRWQAQAAARANPPPPRPPPPPLDLETLPTWYNSLICKVQWQGRTLKVTRDEATGMNWVQPIGGTRWWNIDEGCWHIHSPEDEAALQTELRLHKVTRVQFCSLAEASRIEACSEQLQQQLQQQRAATELPSSSGASSSQHRPAAAFPDHPPTEPLPIQGVWAEPVAEEPSPADYGEAPMTPPTPEDGELYSGRPPTPA